MGCATTTVKISSVIFNIVLAIFGVGAIVWIACNPDKMYEDATISSYIVCVLVVIFAILGCYAAIKESVCLAATCAVFLLLLAILQIIAICIDWDEGNTRSGIATVERAWQNNEMDALQTAHMCCGKVSAQDYVLLNKPIPQSCYAEQNMSSARNLYIQGCSSKLQDYYESEQMWFLIISWLLIAFEFVGFLLAAFLAINFRNKQRRLQF